MESPPSSNPICSTRFSKTLKSEPMNDKLKNLTLTEKAEAAFQQASIRVIERARQTGTPIIVWENDRILERTSDEMETLLKKVSPRAVRPQGAVDDPPRNPGVLPRL